MYFLMKFLFQLLDCCDSSTFLCISDTVEMEEGGLGSVLSNQKQWLCCVPPLPVSGQVGTLLFRNIE